MNFNEDGKRVKGSEARRLSQYANDNSQLISEKSEQRSKSRENIGASPPRYK